MPRILMAMIWLCVSPLMAHAQSLQDILQTHAEEVAKPGRQTVQVVLDDLVASGLPQVTPFLEAWTGRTVWQGADGLFYIAAEDGDDLILTDIDTAAETTVSSDGYTQVRPNGGVRRLIGTALVQFQLSDPDRARRENALESIARRPAADQLAPLQASIDGEEDTVLYARKKTKEQKDRDRRKTK